jgi:hypothetical protein
MKSPNHEHVAESVRKWIRLAVLDHVWSGVERILVKITRHVGSTSMA